MKKTFFAIACLFTLSSVSASADRPVEKGQLPANTQEIGRAHV